MKPDTAEEDAVGREAALHGVPTEWTDPEGPCLLGRWRRHRGFWEARLTHGLDPFGRIALGHLGPEQRVLDRGGTVLQGVNFASYDHLSLSAHPLVRDAAVDAIGRYGLHGAGPRSLQGGSMPLLRLEERLAEWLGCRTAVVFPSGWAAAFSAIRALVRDTDHIVLDSLATSALQDGAAVATRNIHRVPHRAGDAVANRLARIRRAAPRTGILVVTETLCWLDSTTPDLVTLQQACRAHGATLLADVAHDLGAVGEDGLGALAAQGVLGGIDVVTGSLSRVFATNGGFIAGSAPGLGEALHAAAGPLGASTAPSPVQACVANAALDLVRSAEGAQRRRRLMANVRRLREGLRRRAFETPGQRSPIVPVLLGPIARARRLTQAVLQSGALVNLVEHPTVSRTDSRWILQVMADHTPEQLDWLIAVAVAAREAVAQEPAPP